MLEEEGRAKIISISVEDEMKSAYKHAVEKRYHFFSYGDACLIEKKN